jgi:hypothetical protein
MPKLRFRPAGVHDQLDEPCGRPLEEVERWANERIDSSFRAQAGL